MPPSPWLLSLLHHGLALCRAPTAVNSLVRQLHRPTTHTAAVLAKLANNMADNPMFGHCPAELVEELVANSSLPEEQRRAPRDWLQLIITCASQYPEWDKQLPLLEHGRRLARREVLDGLSDEEAMSYWTSLDKLAATFQTSQSCGALTRSGKRCQVPGRAGSLTCGTARHKSKGMPLLVRDRDGESGHTRTGDFVCQGSVERMETETTTRSPGNTLTASPVRPASISAVPWSCTVGTSRRTLKSIVVGVTHIKPIFHFCCCPAMTRGEHQLCRRLQLSARAHPDLLFRAPDRQQHRSSQTHQRLCHPAPLQCCHSNPEGRRLGRSPQQPAAIRMPRSQH